MTKTFSSMPKAEKVNGKWVIPRQTQTFTVVYRTGGHDNCVWKRTCSFETYGLARETVDRLDRMGYLAIIHQTEALEKIGMPTGWEPAEG